MDPAKLKVVDLRAELSSRGLDTKGNKAALVERLQEALDKESGSGMEGRTTIEKVDDDQYEPSDTTLDSNLEDTTKAEGDREGATTDPESEKETQDEDMEQEEDITKDGGSVEPIEYNPELTEELSQDEEKTEAATGHEEDILQKDQSNKTATPVKEDKIESNNEKDPEETAMEVDSQKPIKKEEFEEEVKVKTENSDIKEERESSREDRKRKRSSSPRRDHSRSSTKDEEPELPDNAVTLSWYDSDLNLIIEKDGYTKASPMSGGGFGYIWAGVRSTFGYVKGKLCYQIKLSEFNNVSHLENEPTPNVLRVGWSVFDTSLQLGEEALSFGYGGTGKAAVNCKFQDYGKSFGLNDVVTAYIDFNDGEVSMSYAVNDEFLGEAFKVTEDELKGKALAPHILTKNVKFEVNFGQEEAWFPVEEDYTFLTSIPTEDAVPGPRRPEKKGDCEILMMCGLPGAGKTYWANKHCVENRNKNYNILGTNALIDKMKVMGLPRKANYSGRWDLLIEKCTNCLQKLMYIGSKRWRNYILDQTNVYPAAQRRKMRNFDGFVRKAVVIVPTEEEFTRRVNEREQVEGKDVPDSAVMEMKANFTLPDKSIFDEIIYIELDESESRKMVNKYNDEAISAGYMKKAPQQEPPSKRFRSDFRQGGGGSSGGGRHDRFRSRGPPGGGFRRGGPPTGGNRGSGGGWQRQGGGDRWRDNDRGFRSGGGPGGGFRQGTDRNQQGVGGFRQGGDRNQQRGGGGFRQGTDRNQQGGGGFRQGVDRNQQGGGGGGWRQNTGGERGPPRDRGYGGGDRNRMGGGNDRNRMGGNDRNRMGGNDRNRIGDDRNGTGGFDRNRGGAGRQVQQHGGGGYNRDREDNRQKGGMMKREVGSAGGNVSSSGTNQWSGYQGGGQQGGNAQQSNQWSGQQQSWQSNQQQQNQQWTGYQQQQPQQQQQQWKGYSQQTNAASGGGYGNSQQQQSYNQQQQNYGSGNNWPQQYGSYGGYNQQQQGWGQNWQNWYAQNGTNQQALTQPPPPAK